MKKTMIFAIIALTLIVVAASFSVQLWPHAAIPVPAEMLGDVLYVCPARDAIWTPISAGIRPFGHYITMLFFVAVMILLFNWGWAMYQNLLSDKFKRELFSNPWKFTKFTFWAGVIVLLLTMTPNYFRTVHITGADGNWVLCEQDTPGARAARASMVVR